MADPPNPGTNGSPPPPTSLMPDAVIFCSKEDEEQVESFTKHAEDLMQNSYPVNIYMYTDLAHDGTLLQRIGHLCKLSPKCFFYITENTSKDMTMMLLLDQQIMNSLEGHNSLIPIWSKPKEQFVNLLYGLHAYSGLYESDTRLLRKLKKIFDTDYHRQMKEYLSKKHETAEATWLKTSEVQTELREHALQQQETPDITAEMRISIRDKNGTEKTLQLRVHRTKEEQLRETQPGDITEAEGQDQYSSSSSLSIQEDNAITHNITINQPGSINIGITEGCSVDGTTLM